MLVDAVRQHKAGGERGPEKIFSNPNTDKMERLKRTFLSWFSVTDLVADGLRLQCVLWINMSADQLKRPVVARVISLHPNFLEASKGPQ